MAGRFLTRAGAEFFQETERSEVTEELRDDDLAYDYQEPEECTDPDVFPPKFENPHDCDTRPRCITCGRPTDDIRLDAFDRGAVYALNVTWQRLSEKLGPEGAARIVMWIRKDLGLP